MSLASSSFSRRRFLTAIGAIGAGAALAACGTGDSGSGVASNLKPQQGGNLLVGMSAVSDYLNPLVATTSAVAWVSAPVVESLYDFDASGKSVPVLAAAEPEISADGLTWTIKLKEKVTFSNGDPLTAEDVVFTAETHMNTDGLVRSAVYQHVQGVAYVRQAHQVNGADHASGAGSECRSSVRWNEDLHLHLRGLRWQDL